MNKLNKELIDKSFICQDKEIHFGKLHVVYVRDALEILDNLRTEMIKQYHRSEGNKHKFIKEFFELTDEEILRASNRSDT